MKKYFSKHQDAFITNLISNALWYIITFFVTNVLLWFPLISGFLKSIKNSDYGISAFSVVLAGLSVIFMFFVTTISIIISIKLNKKNKTNEIATDLIFNSLDIKLYFKDRSNVVTYLTYDCSVNKDNYSDIFKKDIIWTGGKYNYTKIIESNGNYILSDSTRTNSPHTYTIDFNKSFAFGDIIYFKLETCVEDNNLSMTPVFSHMVKQQTINLNIRLTVPKNLITNIRASVYRDIGRSLKVPHDIQLITTNVGDLIQYSYSVDNPSLLNNYCIEWDFK